MKSYLIMLEYTDAQPHWLHRHPDHWDWHTLLDISPNEAVSVVRVDKIETPEGHKEELNASLL